MNIMQMENGIMNITQEDKDLLLRYLSMSLSYGLKLKKCNEDNRAVELYSINLEHETIQYWNYKSSSLQIGGYGHLVRYDKLQFKPYLIPISEMSDYEAEELYKAFGFGYAVNNFKITEEWEKFRDMLLDGDIFIPYPIWIKDFQNGVKFLLKNHFDYQGLIPKGLAIAVTEENNPYK